MVPGMSDSPCCNVSALVVEPSDDCPRNIAERADQRGADSADERGAANPRLDELVVPAADGLRGAADSRAGRVVAERRGAESRETDGRVDTEERGTERCANDNAAETRGVAWPSEGDTREARKSTSAAVTFCKPLSMA
mmetsp:Transcript_152817/g.266361  ORF Transcript_152817/g.266361 Transcript_152817/m.266361 type:complete len:138 (+) Transcript_152817:210-623(+)